MSCRGKGLTQEECCTQGTTLQRPQPVLPHQGSKTRKQRAEAHRAVGFVQVAGMGSAAAGAHGESRAIRNVHDKAIPGTAGLPRYHSREQAVGMLSIDPPLHQV